MKLVLSIIAIIFIILGFGMIHNPNNNIVIAGGISIGLGSLFFIILLLKSSKKDS